MFFRYKEIFFKEIDSTNEEAKRLIKSGKASKGTYILAEKQTSGKTTKKNIKWDSPKGNLYVSVIYFLKDKHIKHINKATFVAALAILDSIKSLCDDCKKGTCNKLEVKWPNDILFDSKKISGILIEKEDDYIVIGTGINIKSHPKKTANFPATSLKENAINITKEKFLKLYLKNLRRNLWILKVIGFSPLKEKIKDHTYMMGKNITIVSRNGNKVSGKFMDIADSGELILKMKNGKIHKIISGRIE